MVKMKFKYLCPYIENEENEKNGKIIKNGNFKHLWPYIENHQTMKIWKNHEKQKRQGLSHLHFQVPGFQKTKKG